jgi:hypothetical protein
MADKKMSMAKKLSIDRSYLLPLLVSRTKININTRRNRETVGGQGPFEKSFLDSLQVVRLEFYIATPSIQQFRVTILPVILF